MISGELGVLVLRLGFQQAKCRAGGLVTGGMQAFLGRGDVEAVSRCYPWGCCGWCVAAGLPG